MISRMTTDGGKKLNEGEALSLLLAMRGGSSSKLSEIKDEIHRRIDGGETFFLVKIKGSNGKNVTNEELKEIRTQMNLYFARVNVSFRCGHSEKEGGLVIVPQDKYESIFGRRSRATAE